MSLFRNSQIWAPEYLKQRVRPTLGRAVPLERIWMTIADHFEPLWGGGKLEIAQTRCKSWRLSWPEIARRCLPDTAGNPPRYTFFFPEEEYHPTLIEPLSEMVFDGLADIEIHIHHDGEGHQKFIDRVTSLYNPFYG